MNDCPRRYTQKSGLSVSFTVYVKNRFGGFCFWRGRKMNDCPRRYTQKKGLIGQFHGLRKKPLRRVFAFGGAER